MSEENKELQPQPEKEQTQPEEVILWYTPASQQAEEVVCWYEQPTPLPGKRWREVAPTDTGVWREAARKERKHRRWPWIAAAVVVLAIAAVIVTGLFSDHSPVLPDDGDAASSIVDIFNHKGTSIPRYEGDASVRLTCQSGHGEELSPREVYAKVNPSVVTVVAAVGEYGSVGTGIIMSGDGYILTNAHVISGSDSCWIALDSGVTYDVRLVGYDESEDLAVLKAVDADGLPAAEFGDSDLACVGDTVYAIGNPLGIELRGTLTDGIISAINRAVDVDGKSMTLIQTNAALNNGNSGGPLINAYGQVIGINTLKMSNADSEAEATVEGLGFALPISTVFFVVNDLIATGTFHGYPTIGITVASAVSDDGVPYVGVIEVTEGSGADKAGIQSGDVILAADGQELSATEDLLSVRRNHAVGDEVVLTVWRDGETFDVTVTLQSDR